MSRQFYPRLPLVTSPPQKAFEQAVLEGRLDDVKQLLADYPHEIDVNVKEPSTRDGLPGLYLIVRACEYGYPEMIKYLLSLPEIVIPTGGSDSHEISPVFWAACSNEERVLDVLLADERIKIPEALYDKDGFVLCALASGTERGVRMFCRLLRHAQDCHVRSAIKKVESSKDHYGDGVEYHDRLMLVGEIATLYLQDKDAGLKRAEEVLGSIPLQPPREPRSKDREKRRALVLCSGFV